MQLLQNQPDPNGVRVRDDVWRVVGDADDGTIATMRGRGCTPENGCVIRVVVTKEEHEANLKAAYDAISNEPYDFGPKRDR